MPDQICEVESGMSSRKCRICGSELPEKAKFCPGCGHEVEQHLQYFDTMDSNVPEDGN